jgi:hypothetical protein
MASFTGIDHYSGVFAASIISASPSTGIRVEPPV